MYKFELLDLAAEHTRKAVLVAQQLYEKISNESVPFPEPVVYDCQLLAEIVVGNIRKANDCQEQLLGFGGGSSSDEEE